VLRWIGALVLGLAVAVFAVENDQPVHLVFLGLTAPAVRLAFLVLACLVVGAAVTALVGGLDLVRVRRRVGELQQALAAAQGAARVPVVAPADVTPFASPAVAGDGVPDELPPAPHPEQAAADKEAPR